MQEDTSARTVASPGRARTIRQFCENNNISKTTYFEMKKQGTGPREMRISARSVSITPEAEHEWRLNRERAGAKVAA